MCIDVYYVKLYTEIQRKLFEPLSYKCFDLFITELHVFDTSIILYESLNDKIIPN